MTQYPVVVPTKVKAAQALAIQLGFDLRPEGNAAGDHPSTASCCIDEVGRLLMALAASVTEGVIGEIGTGAGVGTAWLAEGKRNEVALLSVEKEARLAQAAGELFQDENGVEILQGDWRETFVRRGPFQLLFADGGGVGTASADQWLDLAELIAPGGMMVLDDLTPEALWPEAWKNQTDPKREFAFNSGYFHSTEVLSRPNVSTLILVKR